MSWDQIETGFYGETVNFGARQEAGCALYQVDTKATISSAGKVDYNPRVSAAISDEHVSIAVGKQLNIFANFGSDFLLTVNLDYHVDAVAWAEDTLFLLVGDCGGYLHFVYIPNGAVLFSEKILDGNNDSARAFSSVTSCQNQSGKTSILVLGADGKLYSYKDVDLHHILQALQNEDFLLAKKLRGDIKWYLSNEEVSFAILLNYQVALKTIQDNYGVSFAKWDPQRNYNFCKSSLAGLINQNILKCVLTFDGKHLFLLDSKGFLTLWDAHSLVLVSMLDVALVADFILLQESSSTQSPVLVKLAALTRSEENNEKAFVKVFTFPELKLVYTLQVNTLTTLVHPLLDQEEILLLEGVIDDTTDVLSCLRIRVLSEALPESRLSRLLQKRQFDEALRFCKLFPELDDQIVYHEKAIYLAEIGDYSDMIACLSQIKNDELVKNFCIHAGQPNFGTCFRLLNYARSRLCDDRAQGNAVPVVSQSLLEVLSALHRLGTFADAFGISAFSAAKWEHFMHADLVEEIKELLKTGEIGAAFSIWARHKNLFEKVFTNGTVEQLLAVIPENFSIMSLRDWLKDEFIPYIIHHAPTGLETVAAWLEPRIRDMEFSAKEQWPSGAIDMIKVVLSAENELLEVGEGQSVCLLGRYTNKDTSTALSTLEHLFKSLLKLSRLRSKYHCKLTLSEFMQESAESLAYRMLDRVKAIELLPAAIENQVRVYLRENNMDEEKILYNYIKDILKRLKNKRRATVSTWESRAVAVIECILDTNFKFLAIVEAVSKASLPLTDEMRKLAEAGLALNHLRSSVLKHQLEVVELDTVLLKYDITQYNPDTRSLLRMAYYILSSGNESALQDALQIAAVFSQIPDIEMYIFYFKWLILQEKILECMNLLKSLPVEKATVCARRIVINCVVLLEDCSSVDDEDDTQKRNFVGAAVEILRYLDHVDKTVFIDDAVLEQLEKLQNLQAEFGRYPSLKEFQKEPYRLHLLDDFAATVGLNGDLGQTNLVNNEVAKCSSTSHRKPSRVKRGGYARLFRLADILGFSRHDVIEKYALQAAEKGNVDNIRKLCGLLNGEGRCQNACRILYSVACVLSKRSDCPPMVTYEFACRALVGCSPGLLADCLELCHCTQLAVDMHQKCETSDYSLSVRIDQPCLIESTWLNDTYFKEDGLVLESSSALPLSMKFVEVCLPAASLSKKPFVQCRTAGRSLLEAKEMENVLEDRILPLVTASQTLIEYLQQNSLHELAYRYVIATIGCILQVSSAQKMGHAFRSYDENVHLALAKCTDMMDHVVSVGHDHLINFTGCLLSKICSQPKVDISLAIGYLLSYATEKQAFRQIKSLVNSASEKYNILLAIAHIGRDFSNIVHEPSMLYFCLKLFDCAHWGRRLEEMQISFRDAFESAEQKKALLPLIVKHPDVDVEMLAEFCKTFKLDMDDALSLYLEHLLLNTDIAPFVNDKKVDELKQLMTKLEYISHSFECQLRVFVKKLTQILTKMCPYSYELLEFVFSKIDEIEPTSTTKQNLQLLGYLVNYRRRCPATDYEKNFTSAQEESDEMFRVSQKISSLAESRLPFHALRSAPWKIIKLELDQHTVHQWIPITTLFGLEADKVYMTAINNVVEQYCRDHQPAEHDSKENLRNFGESYRQLFAIVHPLLLKIENRHHAVASARWVVGQLPMGSGKVSAIDICVNLCFDWKTNCDDEEQKIIAAKAHEKFFEVWRRLSTEQVLYRYNLITSEYQAYVSRPAKLIFLLYEHPTVVSRQGGCSDDTYPDIHAAVKEIADINQLDLMKIKLALLEKWLPGSSAVNIGQDKSAEHDSCAIPVPSSDSLEDEKRAIYLLQYGNAADNAKFLIRLAFSNPSSKIRNFCRARALRCLFAIADTETIELLSQNSAAFVMEYLKSLQYISKLEQLHLQYNVTTFAKCNKKNLVKGIWRNHKHNSMAVQIVSELCIDYEIIDLQLWSDILQQLLSFKQFDYLTRVLCRLTGFLELLQAEALHKAWQTVIIAPLTGISLPLNDEDEQRCLKSAELVHRCPLSLNLNVQPILEEYLRLGQPGLVVSCLLLLPNDCALKADVLEKLSKWESSTILKQLRDVQLTGAVLPNFQSAFELVTGNSVA